MGFQSKAAEDERRERRERVRRGAGVYNKDQSNLLDKGLSEVV